MITSIKVFITIYTKPGNLQQAQNVRHHFAALDVSDVLPTLSAYLSNLDIGQKINIPMIYRLELQCPNPTMVKSLLYNP